MKVYVPTPEDETFDLYVNLYDSASRALRRLETALTDIQGDVESVYAVDTIRHVYQIDKSPEAPAPFILNVVPQGPFRTFYGRSNPLPIERRFLVRYFAWVVKGDGTLWGEYQIDSDFETLNRGPTTNQGRVMSMPVRRVRATTFRELNAWITEYERTTP